MKVISRKNMPVQVPVNSTFLAYIFLDYYDAPGWLWGALGFMFLMLWIVGIIIMVKEEPVKILEDKDD